MIEGKFDIVFAGRFAPGKEPEQVYLNLAKLFKTNEQQIKKLFSGDRVTIKKGLEYAQAMKYQSALKNAGALVLIQEHGATVKQTAPATTKSNHSSQTAQPQAVPNAAVAAEKTRGRANFLQPEEPTRQEPSSEKLAKSESTKEDASDDSWSVAAAGEKLPPGERQQPIPEPDLSGLSVDSSNRPLSDKKTTEAPSVDLSGLSLNEPGLIQEPKTKEQRDVDTSSLSVAAAGEKIPNEKVKKEEVDPKIDHLELD
ncbi:hypothetical protein [Pleionea sediminis]|uniref:hypothetical protein n=1 Tax=Pleionea sediminis TaxID=2569479 RepID=UPI0011871AAE|nr:hypothetical protein [Pleionea sediminis]